MEGLVGFLPIIAILLVFWFLIIRPQQRRQRETMNLQASIQVGDQVMLTSGFFGTVTDLIEDKADVELAEGVVVTVVRGAIASKVTESFDDEPGHDEPAAEVTTADERPRLEKNPDAGES